jgi:hypothetical protein
MRELNICETEEVSGGILPWLVAAALLLYCESAN